MRAALLIGLSILASAPLARAETVGPSELGLSAGATLVTQTYEGGGTSEVLGYAALQGRTRFLGWLTLDGWAHAGPAFSRDLSQSSFSLALRPGVELKHFGVALGPVAQLAPESPNVAQWLPSITVWGGAGSWRGVLGVLDRPELPILRLGVQYENYSISYVLLGGIELTGRWKLSDVLALDARILASRQLLGNGLSTATIGVTWMPGGKP